MLRISKSTCAFCGTLIVLFAVVSGAFTGCRKQPQGPKLAPVSGKITYRDKPLPHGQVVFIHDSGHLGAGQIRADGNYKVEAAVGENKVMIECTDEPNLSNVDPKAGRELRDPVSLIPAQYRDYNSSGLVIDVVDGDNTRDWKLED